MVCSLYHSSPGCKLGPPQQVIWLMQFYRFICPLLGLLILIKINLIQICPQILSTLKHYFLGNCDFDENVKRVNLRSFRKKLEHYLSQTENGGKFISFIEINDSNTKVKGNEFIENLVYAHAVHQNLGSKNTRSVSKTDSKKLQEVITKDSIITKSKQD